MAESPVTLKITRNTSTSGLYYELDPSATVDNVFSFLDSNGTKIQIVSSKGVYTLRLGGVVAGSNMLSRIQTIISDSRVKSVLFDDGDITITGTLNCAGKKLTFRNGSRIVGTNTLNNGILDCALTDQAFTTGTTLTNFKSTQNEFSCENFGALGAGADETIILQKTSDTLIANLGMPRIIKLLCDRTYATYGWVIYSWNGSRYSQCCLSIVGEKSTMGGNPTFTATINCISTDSFALALQRVTGFTIQGVAITGQLNLPAVVSQADYETFYSATYTTLASAHGVRDTQFSPYSAIVIDPFRNTNTTPTDGGYPRFNATGANPANPSNLNWYRGIGGGDTTGGSTSVTIQDVNLYGFAVGIMISPNAETQQGENTVMRNINANNMKAVIACGQRESKGCLLNMGYSIDRVYTIMDGDSYGANQGTLPNVDMYTISGTVVQFLNGSAQHSLSIKNVYTETLFRVGDMRSQVGMAEFKNCNFVLATGLSPLLIPKSHFTGINVHFDGCTIRYYDDLFNKRAVFIGYGFTFNKCFFDVPPIGSAGQGFSGNQKLNVFEVNYCSYSDGGAFGYPVLKGYIQSRADFSIATGRITIENQGQDTVGIPGYGRMLQEYECGGFDLSNWVPVSSPYTVNTVTKTAVFNGSNQNITVGQYILYIAPSDTVFSVLGRVSAINLSTYDITLVDVPVGIPNGSGTTAQYIISDYQRFRGRFTGVYTFNDIHITNVFGTPTVGEVDAYTGNIIQSYDASTKIAVLRGPALNTGSVSPELYTPATKFGTEKITYTRAGNPSDTAYNNDTIQYFPGDIWINFPGYYGNTTNIAGVRKFKCTVSGYLSAVTIGGGAKQSEWIEIYETDFKITVSNNVDFSVVIPKGTLIREWKLLAKTAGMTVTTGSTNMGTDYDGGTTLTANVSQFSGSKIYADADMTLYFNGITGSGGTLTVNFL